MGCARYCGQQGAGLHIQAAAPNIVGALPSKTAVAWGTGTGCIYNSVPTGAWNNVQPSGVLETQANLFHVNAGLSNSVYGASNTIVPESFHCPIAVYLGALA